MTADEGQPCARSTRARSPTPSRSSAWRRTTRSSPTCCAPSTARSGPSARRPGRQVLQILQDNAGVAATKRIPYCQDTGFVVCFVELGQDVHVTGGQPRRRHQRGRAAGLHRRLPARVDRPLARSIRVNTGDNTPAVIHIGPGRGRRAQDPDHGQGRRLREPLKYKMLTPAEGSTASRTWILECIKTAGPDACPPLIAGVGVGGTFEQAARLSKKALFRELGSPNPDPTLDALEREVLDRANRLGIGPQGCRRRHDGLRRPHPDVSLPHHVAAGRRHDRMPRASAQGDGRVSGLRPQLAGPRVR